MPVPVSFCPQLVSGEENPFMREMPHIWVVRVNTLALLCFQNFLWTRLFARTEELVRRFPDGLLIWCFFFFYSVASIVAFNWHWTHSQLPKRVKQISSTWADSLHVRFRMRRSTLRMQLVCMGQTKLRVPTAIPSTIRAIQFIYKEMRVRNNCTMWQYTWNSSDESSYYCYYT